MTHDEREEGRPGPFGCPDCGGALWEVEDGELTRFRCRVGHAYSEEAMLGAQNEAVERAFWVALRALEEAAAQSKHMTRRMRERGHHGLADRMEEKARDHEARALVIRDALQAIHPPMRDEEAG